MFNPAANRRIHHVCSTLGGAMPMLCDMERVWEECGMNNPIWQTQEVVRRLKEDAEMEAV